MNWHEYYLDMLPLIAAKSKDASTKVGVIIVGPDNEIRSAGFNSFPRGIQDNLPERQDRPEKYLYFEHAERNAIYNAARMGTALKGCRMYMDYYPCADCARALIQAGIISIILDGRTLEKNEKYWSQRWGTTILAAKQMLSEAQIEVIIYNSSQK